MLKIHALLVFILLPMIAFASYQSRTLDGVQATLSGSAIERLSPAERVSWDKINIFDDHVEISMPDTILVAIADTNSMDPVLDIQSKALEITPKSPEDIYPGDIISFKTDRGIIIHRVIETGYDEKGWFAITKGDNVLETDGKIRWEQVKRILIGIIY